MPEMNDRTRRVENGETPYDPNTPEGTPGEYEVTYTVPVTAVVQVDEDGTREVTRVIVADEEIVLDAVENTANGVPAWVIEWADTAEWPGWEFGW